MEENNICTTLCIGDQHFKKGNKKITEKLKVKTLELMKEIRPDFIVLLGDLCHHHNMAEVRAYNRAVNYLKTVADYGKEIDTLVFFIIGNHDRENNRDFMTDLHFFNSLKQWPNKIYIVDKTITVDIKNRTFCFVPYVPDGKFSDALAGVDINSLSGIFCHQTFSIYSPLGDNIPDTYPVVISGHIHDYLKKGRITYVGTPYQTAHGETDKKSVSKFIWSNERDPIEERIFLKLNSKITHQILFKDFEKYRKYREVEDISELRVEIILKDEEYKTLTLMPLYHRLLKKNVKIKTTFVDNELAVPIKNKVKNVQSYETILYNNLNDQEKILFNKLFPS